MYFSQRITEDTLESIFVDIWLCSNSLFRFITSSDMYVFFKVPTLLTEGFNWLIVEVVGSGLLLLLYKFLKSRKEKI